MILPLLTTTLLLLGSGGGYQVAYNQVDEVSGVVDTYEIHQRAVINNESGNLEISYNISSDEFGTFSIFGDIDTIGIDEYIDDIPSYLDFVPLFWFTFENGEFVPIEQNPLALAIGLYNGNTNSILTNTSEYGYLFLESYIGENVDDSYYYGQPLEDLYYSITGLIDYNYEDIGEGFFYHYYTFYLDVNDWVITGDNFADLNLDLYFTIGHYKQLKEMSYSVNGLGSKVESIYQQGYQNGAATNDAYYLGQESILQNPNDYNLYTENQYNQNYDRGYNDGELDAEIPVGLEWVKSAINVFMGFLGFMILPGVTFGDIVSGILILMILKFVLDWFRG